MTLVIWAKQYLDDYQAALQKPKLTVTSDVHGKRSPPEAGYWKLNFDAAVFTNSNSCGIGVLIRSHQGQFIAGLSKKLDGINCPMHAKLLAATEIVRLAAVLGGSQCIFESDRCKTNY